MGATVMSNTPNQDPYSNQDPAQNYGNTPPSPYSGQPQSTPPPPEQYGYNAPPPNYQPNVPTGYGNQYPPNPAMQQSGYGYAVPPVATSPLPLGEALRQLPRQYLRVLTKPSAETFAAEQGKAAWNVIWVQLLVVGVLSTIFGIFISNITISLLLNNPNIPVSVANSFRGIAGTSSFGGIVSVPLLFFIGTGIYHLIAKAFGGTGKYLPYAYSYLLFYVPISIASLILSLIPFLGSLAAFALSIYAIVMQIYMTMGVHRLSGGRATLAVLLLPIIALVLFIVLFIVIIAVVAGSLRNR